MSLQRFETAVAFFLLGKSIWDAVGVCIDKLNDFQLALLITRLLEGDRGVHYHRLLNCYVLCKGENSRDIPGLNLNPYLRSMAYWQMDDYSNAIDTLLEINPRGNSGSLCNFYLFLKAHPLICKFRKQTSGVLSQDEVRLVFNTAYHYLDRGSPLLAMLVILKFDKEHFALTSRALSQRIEVESAQQHLDTRIHTGTLSSELFTSHKLTDISASKETSDSFDWSQPSFSILTSVDFEPPKLSEKAADYDWSVSSSFHASGQEPEIDFTPHVVHESSEDKTLPYKEISTDDSNVVLDLRPALLHAKFLTSLSFLCQSLSRLRAVNGEVLNSAKFNTSLRQLISTELEQTAVNLNLKHEFTSLRPLMLQLAEFLTFSHHDSLPAKQASITLIYSLVSTDFSHLHAATQPTSSIPLYTSASLPAPHFQNILSYVSNQVTDLFNFIKRFRFPFYPLSPDTGVDMIWPQAAIISTCILTSLSSLNFGISHNSSAIKDSSVPAPLYKLSGGSYNNKLASWPGVDRDYLNDVTHKRVTILLGEASACVLLALFANAYMQQNAKLMSLLLHNSPDEKMWCEVFCGGEFGPPVGCPVMSILDFYLREYSHPVITTEPMRSEEVLIKDTLYDSDDSEITQPLSAYIWSLISLCAIKKVLDSVKHISTLIGIDNELPLKSPLLCQIKTQAQRWEKDLGDYLDSSCSLTEQIRSSSNDSSNSSSLRSMIVRHMKALERAPTSELPSQMRDLLEYLEQMEETRETLLYYLRSPPDPASVTELYKPKVVFRDEDPVHAFCYSPNNSLILALSTSKHIFEIDISRFDSGQWIEDPDTPQDDPSPAGNRTRIEDFLMVYQPTDKRESPLMGGGAHEQTGVTSSVLIKRAQLNVRRMEAHPELPYYLCGTQDGAVHLCQLHNEGIVQCLCKSHASITAIHFTHQGNKFGILDKEGSFSSCQGIYTSMSQPRKLIPICHSRSSEDFCYLSSSSFIATCGHANDSANVRLWDLLMPPKRMVVKQFYCHQDGCTVLAYSQRHQQLISGGRKGDVSIFDIRQQSLIQRIEAHSDAVRAIALNSSEDFYVTGCSSGSAKLWGLTVHNPIRTFSMLHPKSSIFRSEPGITQLSLTDDGYLLSSGGDGTIRRSAVHHLL